LSGEVAVIIGQGNVAVDIARALTKPMQELRSTDMAAHAVAALEASRIREVHIVGRRGPAQAKFTNKELRELGEISGCVCEVREEDLELNEASRAELADKNNFVASKNVEILGAWTNPPPADAKRRIVFHFFEGPLGIEGNGRVDHIVLERNQLSGAAFNQQARGTGQTRTLRCDLVFRSIGYLGCPLPGVPFDPVRGVIPNESGRVVGTQGLYAVGWIKRGPSGIIGTNRADAVATVQTLVADVDQWSARALPGIDGLRQILAQRGVQVVNYAGWQRIDAEERRRGECAGKPREKYCSVDAMLEATNLPT
jgi:ferredoxin--NADP+ reductase